MDEPGDLVDPRFRDADWQNLVDAAEAAGRLAARELARCCSVWELGRKGQVWVYLEPRESPVVSWLMRHRPDECRPRGSGVLSAITVLAGDLRPTASAEAKAHSLLVARAYAAAYGTVLAEEADVVAETVTLPAPAHSSPLGGLLVERPDSHDTEAATG